MTSVIATGLSFLPSLIFGGKATHSYFKNPHKIRTVQSNFRRYEVEESRLRERLIPVLEKNGITKDIQIKLVSQGPIAASSEGTHTRLPMILARSEFMALDELACQFALKHEIGHIKNNDTISCWIILTSVSVAMGIFFPYVVGTSILVGMGTCLASLLVCCIVHQVLIQSQEKWADNFAIANASDEELCGALRLFKACQKAHKNVWWPGSTHPSDSSRIEKCEQELRKRGKEYTETFLDRIRILNIARLISSQPLRDVL